jgi:kynureninase
VNDPMIVPARPVPLDLSAAFARFRNADPERLHFAAHSHHLWPDVARNAHIKAWDDAARLTDDKWDNVLNTVWPEVSAAIARHLRLADATTLVPAPNTHEFVNRLLSCGPTEGAPRVLTTDGEFHSFRRQSERLAEDGLIAQRRAGRTICDACREACGGGARVGARLCLCEPSAFQFRFCSS